MAKRSKKRCEELPILHPDAAGIYVGASELFVAVSADRDPQPVRSFPTFISYKTQGRGPGLFASSLQLANSFGHTLLADPHPINPVVSIFYENIGRGPQGPRLGSLPILALKAMSGHNVTY